MQKKNFLRRVAFFEKVTKSRDPSKYFKDDTGIHCLCELCLNLLRIEQEIPLNKRDIEKLRPWVQIFQTLANNNKSVRRKRQILDAVWDDFKPLLKKTILPKLKKLKFK